MPSKLMKMLDSKPQEVRESHHSVNINLRQFWTKPCFGLNLLIMFLDSYGTEGLKWDPTTIEMDIQDDFNVELPPANFARLMTAISILTSNSFYTSVPDFVQACVTLSGTHPTSSMILPDADDIAWGVTEGVLISPPEDEQKLPFNEEIVAFIGETLADEGILTPPDVLRIAGKGLMDQVSYDYSDDPEMFTAIQSVEKDRSDNINRIVIGRTHALLQQMQSLPLRTGKVHFVEKLLAKLPPAEEVMPLSE